MMEREATFGTWLRRQRHQLDLTQLELAQQVGCSVVTIRKLERNELRPSKQLAEQLLHALHIAPAQQAILLAFARGVGPAPQLDPAAATAGDGSPPQTIALPLRQHNLPASTTALVGRERELAELQRLLERPDDRLVTILGTGGMGKTHLAQEVARRHLGRTQESVFFVALASLPIAEGLTTTITDALGYPLQQDGRSLEQQLLDYVQRKQMLFVLDNFEHVLAGAGLVNAILRVAPGVKILVTSREPLQLSGETLYRLGSLAYPGETTTADLFGYGAIQLFIQRVRHSRPTFEPNTADYAAIARICRLVEGMPLGILLAAAWANQLSVQVIADEISQSFDFLETDLRDLPERHRSIRAVFEHSWRRLSAAERTVFMRLAVFHGGFTRQAAQRVAGASLHQLRRLVNQSLLQVEQEEQYTLHELLRQYAATELVSAGQAVETHHVHSSYYASFLAQRAEELTGRGQQAALQTIVGEFENVRAAWQWSIEQRQVEQLTQAIEGLGAAYAWQGRFEEGEQALGRAAEKLAELESSDARHLLVKVLIWQARFGHVLGHHQRVRQGLQRGLALLQSPELRKCETRPQQAALLQEMGDLAMSMGDRQEASALFQESLTLCRSFGDRRGEAQALLALERIGRSLLELGDPAAHWQQTTVSLQLVLQSLAIFRELEDLANIARALEALGIVYLTRGQAVEAQAALKECIAICKDFGSGHRTYIGAIGYLGVAYEYLGLYDQMRVQGQMTLALAQEISDADEMHLGYYVSGCAALAQKQYEEAQQWLGAGVELNRAKGKRGPFAFSLVCMGLATYWGGNKLQSQHQFMEALRLANEIRTIRATVQGLLLGGLLLTDQGKCALAVELHALAMCYPFVANSRWCADVAGRAIEALIETMRPDVVAAAQEQGRARDLWETADYLLAELASNGSSVLTSD